MAMLSGWDLRSWTTGASLYSVVISMLGITWTVQLLLNLTVSPTGSFLNQPKFSSVLPDRKVITDITWIMFFLQIMRFITSFILLHGNMANRLLSVCSWIISVTLLVLWSIGSSIYIATRLTKSSGESLDSADESPDSFYSYVILLSFFFGGFIAWIVDVGLLYVVSLRYKEISKGNTETTTVSDGSYRFLSRTPKGKKWSLPMQCWTISDNFEEHLTDDIAIGTPSNTPLMEDAC